MPLAPGAPPRRRSTARTSPTSTTCSHGARAFTRGVVSKLTDADLMTEVTRPRRPDGTQRVFNVGWVIYHLIEHEAQHRGQINLLKHLLRATTGSRGI